MAAGTDRPIETDPKGEENPREREKRQIPHCGRG